MSLSSSSNILNLITLLVCFSSSYADLLISKKKIKIKCILGNFMLSFAGNEKNKLIGNKS